MRADQMRGFEVDRVEREDGRYVLYYRWPTPEEGDAGDRATARPPTLEPWNPESGAADV